MILLVLSIIDFLSIKCGAKNDPRSFFNSQPVGKNFMASVAKHICTALNIYGDNTSQYMTTHVLRATMMSLLIAAGHSDALVLLCYG